MKNLRLHNTPTPQLTRAYILGILHDATERKYTYRVSQSSLAFVRMVAKGVKSLGYTAWYYKEGRNRDVYVVEFSKKIIENFEISSLDQKTDYVRGYFDSEGGIPKDLKSRYYIYFSQKDLKDLEEVKSYLLDLGIKCGKTHVPSKRVDPDYYRFYVLSESFNDFALKIGSWHPAKAHRLRMKI